MTDEKKVTILAHLQELRKRLLWSVIAVVITTAISFFFAKHIFSLLESRAEGINLIYIEMTEMIGTYCKVAFISGLALALPFLVYQFVMFLHPALAGREKKYLYFLLPGVLLCFAAGVLFGYYILVPPAAKFLITFGSDIATPQIKVANFVSLMTKLLFGIGLCFEIPIIIFFLSKIGIITPKKLSKYRKFAVVGAFVLGAIITPTFDPVNQSLVAVPIIVLFEIGLFLGRIGAAEKEWTKVWPISLISRITIR